jgi:GMP synthase (glutamine-hydrolysing)
MNKDMILILDFGGNQAQAMARMLRNAGVYCEVLPYSAPIDLIKKDDPRGIIMAGGRDDLDIECDYEVYLLRTPVLAMGSCARHMLRQLGGRVLKTCITDSMVYLESDNSCPLLDGVSDCERPVRRIHALELPESFRTICEAEGMTAGFAYEKKRLFALQYDIEANDPEGLTIINNFINDICSCERWWSIPVFIQEKIEEIRAQVGDGHALMALSGGVDSSVCAALMHHAIGDRLHCIYVDTGLMRKGDTEQIENIFCRKLGMNVTIVDAKSRFLNKLRGITDPKEKWRVVSEEFASVYTEEASELHKFDFLVEGTIYSDVLRGYDLGYTLPVNGETVLSDKVMIEPVRDLFKEEVRSVGEVLGLPREIIRRQSFPGAGLGIRIVGEATEENLKLLREADAIWHEEIVAAGLDKRIRRYFAVLTETTSTGRTHCEHIIALCALGNSGIDYTAYRMPYDLLERVTARILYDLPKIDRVVYDMTTTPPRPVEWE